MHVQPSGRRKKIGAIFIGENCKCAPGRARSQFLEHILVGGGDLERGGG